jgi:DNA-binding NtrC family response regulator
MRGKVLIVEDYGDWRDLLSGLLRREGLEVAAVATADEARERINTITDLDLAIIDIRLVESDQNNEEGMRLLAEIAERQQFTRVIMITGHGTMELQRRAFRRFQAFDFFRKEQFNSEDFRGSCQEAVQQAARERQAWRDKEYIRDQRFQAWRRDKD